MTTSTASGFYVGDENNSEKYRLVRQVGSGGEATLWLGYLLVGGSEEKVAIRSSVPSTSMTSSGCVSAGPTRLRRSDSSRTPVSSPSGTGSSAP